MDGSIHLGSVRGPLGVYHLVVSHGVIGGIHLGNNTKPKAAVASIARSSPHAEACTLRNSHMLSSTRSNGGAGGGDLL